jgi:hypothetical protein
MVMVELSSVELKLLRLVLDPGAQSGEAENARRKLLQSLAKRGLSSHDIVEVLTDPEKAQEMAPPKMSKPDYRLCRMPFGKTKGQSFMDFRPDDLRGAIRWAKRTPELAKKFAEFIHDGEAFLNQ